MLFPVKCFTCGKPIGDKWYRYYTLTKDMDDPEDEEQAKKRSEILAALGIKRMCCKIHFLTHADIVKELH